MIPRPLFYLLVYSRWATLIPLTQGSLKASEETILDRQSDCGQSSSGGSESPGCAPTVAADEAAAWAEVQGIAEAAVEFWDRFLRLQSGTNRLGDAERKRILCLVRAVSWVESKHGTGSGASASADPMQCANPADAWWKELTNCDAPQDRFVGGVGASNYNACELPAKASAEAGFPSDADTSRLADPTKGHDDPKFRLPNRPPQMSFYWGVPILIHKMNTRAGDKTYQCRDLTKARLVAGAKAYNGGGDPNYETKITKALDDAGCLAVAASPASSEATDPQTIINACEDKYEANKNDCNAFLKAVATELGVTTFQAGDDADAIVQRMIDSADWKGVADGPKAKEAADAGSFVIAGLKGADHTPPRTHGHVAVVVKGPLAQSKYPTAYWGSLGGSPGRNKTLNFSWSTADRDNVEYYSMKLSGLISSPQTGAGVDAVGVQALCVLRGVLQQLEGQGGGLSCLPDGVQSLRVSVKRGRARTTVDIGARRRKAGRSS